MSVGCSSCSWSWLHTPFRYLFHHTATTVRPLKELCRFTISANLAYKESLKLLNTLPLPQHLLRFVCATGGQHTVCVPVHNWSDDASAMYLQLLAVSWCWSGATCSTAARPSGRYGIIWCAIATSSWLVLGWWLVHPAEKQLETNWISYKLHWLILWSWAVAAS